jgi:hypothetical protein
MNSVSLGKPTIIDGHEVILIKDMVGIPNTGRDGEVYSIIEERGVDGRPAIYAAEEDIIRLREHYPGVKVYGLWQLLFHNNKVVLGEEVIIFPTDEVSGFYLIMDGGADLHDPANIAKSGEYVNNYVVDHITYDLANAAKIVADIAALKLPKNEAYTRVELSNKLKTENSKRWMVVGGLCALIGVAALSTNYGLSTVYKSKIAEYNTQQALVDELSKRQGALQAERLLVRPDDRRVLERIYALIETYPKITTPQSDAYLIGFTGDHVLITEPDASVHPASVVAGIEAELLPNLAYQITIQTEYEDSNVIAPGEFDEY